MKRLVLVGAVLAATVLSGCVVYPHGGGRHYHSQPGYDGGGPARAPTVTATATATACPTATTAGPAIPTATEPGGHGVAAMSRRLGD